MSIQRKGRCIWFVKVIITTHQRLGDLNNRNWHLIVVDKAHTLSESTGEMPVPTIPPVPVRLGHSLASRKRDTVFLGLRIISSPCLTLCSHFFIRTPATLDHTLMTSFYLYYFQIVSNSELTTVKKDFGIWTWGNIILPWKRVTAMLLGECLLYWLGIDRNHAETSLGTTAFFQALAHCCSA